MSDQNGNGNGPKLDVMDRWFDGKLGKGVRIIFPLICVPLLLQNLNLSGGHSSDLQRLSDNVSQIEMKLDSLTISIDYRNRAVDGQLGQFRIDVNTISSDLQKLKEAEARREGAEDRAGPAQPGHAE